ncbi:hypothetical protein B4907_11435 [Yersinia kristensenii]|nr:hypothetical protein B4907_11435 [Yersinia kristensenii]
MTAQSFVAGTGETDLSGVGVWVRADVVSELNGSWYGMSSGTNATPMLQSMAKTAGIEGYGVYFPAGNFILSGSSATFLADNSTNGNVKYIKGTGKLGTIFNVDITTLNGGGIIAIGSINALASGYDAFHISGIKLRGTGTRETNSIYTGTGLYVQNMNGFVLEDINTENFSIGLILQNSLYGLAIACRFRAAKQSVIMRRNGLTTGVNSMEFLRCDFHDNAIHCVYASESHAVKFNNCTFEGNGGKLDNNGVTPIVGVACVQTDMVGGAGGVGAVFDTCYFEANSIMDIVHVVNANRSQSLVILNSIFNKLQSGVSAPRVQVKCTLTEMSSTNKMVLSMSGNKILAGITDSYPDVEIVMGAVVGTNMFEFLDYDNTYASTSAIPVAKDLLVVWKKAADDGVICRGISAGGFTAAQSRNVISCTRQNPGIYRIITNQLTSKLTFQVQLDNAGFSTVSTAENNGAFTLNTYNSAGALADVGFRVLAKTV